ncbi:MAG: sigma-70 family RNA polymerase sigma factor [Oscillospiraceae bacterium]|nr:sigma-70 family RNA polymerase sigma factor [Oscillospiraceae bacterium]
MEHEHDLIRQIIGGNTELFEKIVVKYQNLVYTVCLNIVGDSGEAENMAQETFLSAYSSLSGFRGDSFKSWICRIAVNKSIDYKRKRYIFEDYAELESVADIGNNVEELAERKERRHRLSGILNSLPEKYSAVIKSFYYDGLPVKEIANRMNKPERTVETRLYRAKKLVKERWGEDDG